MARPEDPHDDLLRCADLLDELAVLNSRQIALGERDFRTLSARIREDVARATSAPLPATDGDRMMRGYDLNVSVWGPGVRHERLAALELGDGSVTLVVLDPLDQLERVGRRILSVVRERRGAGEDEPTTPTLSLSARVADDAPGSPHSRVLIFAGVDAEHRKSVGVLTTDHQEALRIAAVINGMESAAPALRQGHDDTGLSLDGFPGLRGAVEALLGPVGEAG